jgi:hypothetical protein
VLTDQVKLTCALFRDLDEAIKEVKLLGEHDEESSQKITELEALCKRLMEDTQKLKEEKITLEGMIQSRDELIMEMAEEYRLNHMGENDDDEDKDDDDEGNATAPLHLCHLLLHLRRSSKKKPPWRWFLSKRAPVAHEVILAYAEPELSQPRLFNMIMRDDEESPPWMENGLHELDDLDDLDDLIEADYNMDEWFPEDGSSDRE